MNIIRVNPVWVCKVMNLLTGQVSVCLILMIILLIKVPHSCLETSEDSVCDLSPFSFVMHTSISLNI